MTELEPSKVGALGLGHPVDEFTIHDITYQALKHSVHVFNFKAADLHSKLKSPLR